MTIDQFILLYWPIITAALAAVIWAIRLEGRIGKADTAIRALWKQREEDQRGSVQSRSEVHDSLNELRHDVKQILRELGSVK